MIHPNGQINKQTILSGSYASSTSANENESEISDSTTSSSSNTLTNNESVAGLQNEKFTKKKSGFDLKMTNAEKIMEFRKTIENYNLQIIEECNPLFFALY